jgi:Tfp pilus assembly protein PilX
VAAKLCVLILGLGVMAVALLQFRQARLQAVHDLAGIQREMLLRDRELFAMRSQIAQAVTPERVQQIASTLGPLRPIGVDPLPGVGDTALAADLDPTKPTVRPASLSREPAKPAKSSRGTPSRERSGAPSASRNTTRP